MRKCEREIKSLRGEEGKLSTKCFDEIVFFSTSDLKFYFKTERAEIAQTCRISFIFPHVIVHF